MTDGGRFRYSTVVRYAEADQQGVVFNAHYLTYCDETINHWLRWLDIDLEALHWDMMVKRVLIEWTGAARYPDRIDLVPTLTRWGNTSFEVRVRGSVAERPVFAADITYVGVERGTYQPMPPPASFRAALA